MVTFGSILCTDCFPMKYTQPVRMAAEKAGADHQLHQEGFHPMPMARTALAVMSLLLTQAQAAWAEAPAAVAPASGAAAQAEAPAEKKADPGPLKIGDRLTLSGDFRYRHESNFELDDQPARNRERIRFRLGLDVKVLDSVTVGTRLRTGNPEDPKAPHQTLGDGFDSFELNLDRAFVVYRPGGGKGFWATGGKFGHPFAVNPVYGELVWDQDVQPEGVVVGHSFKSLGAVESLDISIGEYALLEQSASDVYAAVGQVSAKIALGESVTLRPAIGYYHYDDPTPDGSGTILADNAGNATADTDNDSVADAFLSDFHIWDGLLSLTFSGWKVPLILNGEYISNAGSQDDGDKGWAAGVAAGKTGAAGDWQAYYQYQVVEQDAVFSVVSQDDFLFSTNFRSHAAGFRYRLQKPLEVHLWALVARRDETSPGLTTDSEDFQWRARLDLNVSF